MVYTKEEIERYLEILRSYNNVQSEGDADAGTKVRCRNCQSDSFFIESGYNICDSCGMTNSHIFERRVFIRESITMRKRLIKFPENYT